MSEPKQYFHFTIPTFRPPNLSWIKSNPGVSLMVASIMVSATRLGDGFANAAGFQIDSPVWDMLHAASGIALALIESVAVFYCARALSKAASGRRTLAWWILAILITVSIGCLFVIGWDSVTARANHKMVQDILTGGELRLWSAAIALSNLILLVCTAIADHLNTGRIRSVNTVDGATRVRHGHKPALGGSRHRALPAPAKLPDQAFIDAWNAMPEAERSLRKMAALLGINKNQVAEYKERLIK